MTARTGGRVSDAEVEALRAYVTGNTEEYTRLRSRFDRAQIQPFVSLISAVFLDAVDLRFHQARDQAAVIEYVARLRAKSAWYREELDPVIAERLIRYELGDGSVQDLDRVLAVETKQRLLVALVSALGFSDRGLARFLARARRIADGWLERMERDQAAAEQGGQPQQDGQSQQGGQPQQGRPRPPTRLWTRLRARWTAWLRSRGRNRPVTAYEVAAIRGYLTGDLRRTVWSCLRAGLAEPLSVRFSIFVQVVLSCLLSRKFAADSTMSEVIRYVAEVRGRESSIRELDPRLCEQLILFALGHGPGPSGKRKIRRHLIRLSLMRVLVADLGLDAAGLDELLAEARARTDRGSAAG